MKMQTNTCYIDNWSGSENHDIEYKFDSSCVAAALLKKLDGKNHTLLSFNIGDGYLMIGGGPKHFICTLSFDGVDSITAAGNFPENKHVNIELTCGGQIGEFPPQICCSILQANNIVLEYVSSGLAYTGLKWINDN